MTRIAIFMPPALRHELLDDRALSRLRACGEVTLFEEERPVTAADAKTFLRDAEICLSSWGSPKFDADVVAALPNLKLIVYCAGSVKPWVSEALWARGIRVTSGAPAIGVAVAEFVLALALLARRGAFAHSAAMRTAGKSDAPSREVWGATVGLVSLGQVGRKAIELLRPLGPAAILAYDPHVPAEAMAKLGAQKVELEVLLRRSDLVSLHAPNLPETRHLIGARELGLMKDDAVFINTARGAVVDEPALIAELRKGRLFACLDVTDPEPPAADNPLRTLPNVFLTPHIAGNRTRRLGVQAAEEVERYLAGQVQVYEVRHEQLAVTA